MRAIVHGDRIVKVLGAAMTTDCTRRTAPQPLLYKSHPHITVADLEKIMEKMPLTLADLNRKNAEFWRSR